MFVPNISEAILNEKGNLKVKPRVANYPLLSLNCGYFILFYFFARVMFVFLLKCANKFLMSTELNIPWKLLSMITKPWQKNLLYIYIYICVCNKASGSGRKKERLDRSYDKKD